MEKQYEKGDSVRTIVSMGKAGPSGRMPDGRALMFTTVPEDFKIGAVAEVMLTRVEENYAVGEVTKMVEIPYASEHMEVTIPAGPKFKDSSSNGLEDEEGWTHVRVRSSRTGTKSLGFHLPDAISHSMQKDHRSMYDVKFRLAKKQGD